MRWLLEYFRLMWADGTATRGFMMFIFYYFAVAIVILIYALIGEIWTR